MDPSSYPKEWDSDTKMGLLLAPFRAKNVNAEAYDYKMKFWKDMIKRYCGQDQRATISIKVLKEVFKRDNTSPYCLQEVFDELLREKTIVPKSQFLEEKEATWSGWAVKKLVKQPLSWGFGKIKDKLWIAEDPESCEYIVQSVVVNQSVILQNIVKKHYSFNKIVSMKDLVETVQGTELLSTDGFQHSLNLLVHMDQVYVEQNIEDNAGELHKAGHHHKMLLKFSDPHNTVAPITEIERSIYNLEHTEKFLLVEIDKADKEIDEVMVLVRQCLRDKKKQVATTHLRKKHLLEKELERKAMILENITTMLQRIHGSRSDKEIINTYKLGSNALKTTMTKEGINLDNVDDIIGEMREVLEEQEEINRAVSEPYKSSNYIDDAELEKELQELLDAGNGSNANGGVSVNNDDIYNRLMKLRMDGLAELTEKSLPTASKLKQ